MALTLWHPFSQGIASLHSTLSLPGKRRHIASLHYTTTSMQGRVLLIHDTAGAYITLS
uniref:Uncharacterized protein n=1 Tax=Arundo donax TaxID=35708 RepID=A0A0A9E5E4_ARUDO